MCDWIELKTRFYFCPDIQWYVHVKKTQASWDHCTRPRSLNNYIIGVKATNMENVNNFSYVLLILNLKPIICFGSMYFVTKNKRVHGHKLLLKWFQSSVYRRLYHMAGLLLSVFEVLTYTVRLLNQTAHFFFPHACHHITYSSSGR